MKFDLFRSQMLELAFDQVVRHKWAPYARVSEHAHPFSVSAMLAEGEMSLRVGAVTRHLRAGDKFELREGEMHEEHYGANGATYWVARRHLLRADDTNGS